MRLIRENKLSITTPKSLRLGFGVLIALLILSGLAILIRVWSIEGLVQEQANIARPRSAATRELEIHALAYALTTQRYVQTGAPKLRQDAAAIAVTLERTKAEYERLIRSAEQRELITRFTALWHDLRLRGDMLMDTRAEDIRSADLEEFHRLRARLMNLLENEMQANAIAIYNARRDETLDSVQSIVEFAVGLLVLGVIIAALMSIAVSRSIIKFESALQQAYDTLEARVRERTNDLETSNEALLRSNRELEQFSAVASHDLQEPLRKIQAFGDRLHTKCGDKLDPSGQEYLDRILVSAARMRRLIDDLLAFSRLSTRAQPFITTDLNVVAKEVISDLEGRILDTGGQVDVVDELPLLDADPSQMRQLLQNLIVNGLKFHRPGVLPRVRISSRRLADDAFVPGVEQCEISVEDNGIGFEEIYLDRIFELFQRLHGRNEYEGTGIGLAICRKIVERHGGRLTATSLPGQGATFLITLPIQQSSN